MKKILTLLAIALGVALAASCSKTDSTDVTITFNGNTYTNARLFYFSDQINQNQWIFWFMLNPGAQNQSTGHIYYYPGDNTASFMCSDPQYRSTVESGTVSITKDGQNYNININGTDAAENKVVFQGIAVYAEAQ